MVRIEDELKANGEKWKRLKEQYRMNRKTADEEKRRRQEAIAKAELEVRFKIPRSIQ